MEGGGAPAAGARVRDGCGVIHRPTTAEPWRTGSTFGPPPGGSWVCAARNERECVGSHEGNGRVSGSVTRADRRRRGGGSDGCGMMTAEGGGQVVGRWARGKREVGSNEAHAKFACCPCPSRLQHHIANCSRSQRSLPRHARPTN